MNATTISQKLDAYERLIRLDKPVGFMLLMWPTLWGVWIAGSGMPEWQFVVIFALGTVLMRSAGCAVNDWADRDFDGAVKRTEMRPLAAGEISGKEALIVAAVCALGAAALLPFLEWKAQVWAIPALLIAIFYPFTKRFFAVPQAILGLAFSMGIPMAFEAIRGEVTLIAWMIVVANFFWVMAYDTEYAMVDRDDDLRIGIHTSAIFFGRYDVAAVMASHALFLTGMAVVGRMAGLGIVFYVGLGIASVLAMQQLRQIIHRDRMQCFAAFRSNNWLGMTVWIGLVADYALRWKTFPVAF